MPKKPPADAASIAAARAELHRKAVAFIEASDRYNVARCEVLTAQHALNDLVEFVDRPSVYVIGNRAVDFYGAPGLQPRALNAVHLAKTDGGGA